MRFHFCRVEVRVYGQLLLSEAEAGIGRYGSVCFLGSRLDGNAKENGRFLGSFFPKESRRERKCWPFVAGNEGSGCR